MLKLLLDEHISPDVAERLRRRAKGLTVLALAEWQEGSFLGRDDNSMLRAAAVEMLTLVTYDRRTIPPLLKVWAEAGQVHGGVIFVDEKTIAVDDFGGLIRSLAALAKEGARWDWTDRVCFLRR